jgi:hypothetical protein
MTGIEPGYPIGGPAGLPDIEELTIEPPEPGRYPFEISAIMRHSMGLIDAPLRFPDPARPDVSDLQAELGL